MNHSLKVAALQCVTKKGDVNHNLSVITQAATAARDAGAELLVCPELCTTGYDAGRLFDTLAEPQNGPGFERLSTLARSLGLALCYGYAERDNHQLFNAAQLIDHQGNRIQHHRKTQLYGAYEHTWFTPGTTPGTVVDYRGFKFTTLICYEIEFPELARHNAKRGTNVLLVPTAVQHQPGIDDVTQLLVRARATENNAFVVYANHAAGPDTLKFSGHSIIAGPGARTYALSVCDQHTLLFAELHTDAIAETEQVLPYLADLRTDLFST